MTQAKRDAVTQMTQMTQILRVSLAHARARAYARKV